MPEIQIKFEMNQQQKQQAVEAVLADLPEWLVYLQQLLTQLQNCHVGLPELGRRGNRFYHFKETSSSAAEIHCMDVKKRYHDQGIGPVCINS